MLSPYSQLCADFFTDLNQFFINYFQLADTYRREGIENGDRYGIITVRSLEPDTSHGTDVRQGFQFLLVKMEILMTFGSSDRISSESLALSAALDLHHGIPALKQFFDDGSGLIYDLKTDEQITTVKRQALKPPNNYIVDVVCGAIANMSIVVDIDGKHVMR